MTRIEASLAWCKGKWLVAAFKNKSQEMNDHGLTIKSFTVDVVIAHSETSKIKAELTMAFIEKVFFAFESRR